MTRTRSGIPIIERYLLVDLTGPNAPKIAARDDLRMLNRRFAGELELSVRQRPDGRRAIIKVVVNQEDALTLAGWLQGRSWWPIVMNVGTREEAQALVAQPAWQEDAPE